MATRKTSSQFTVNGYAWEYAIVDALGSIISHSKIKKDKSYHNKKENFGRLDSLQQFYYSENSIALVNKLLEVEPSLVESVTPEVKLTKLDVIDIMISKQRSNLGITAKHNHAALRHPRISAKIDIIRKWGLGMEPSPDYWKVVTPYFAKLNGLIKGIKKADRPTWEIFSDKEKDIYSPIQNLVAELFERRLVNPNTIQRWFNFVTGGQDFYWFSLDNKKACIEGFNLKGTLQVPQWEPPTKLLDIRKEKSNKVILDFDHGYVTSLRVHTASSKVQNSLKFELSLDSHPVTFLYTIPTK